MWHFCHQNKVSHFIWTAPSCKVDMIVIWNFNLKLRNWFQVWISSELARDNISTPLVLGRLSLQHFWTSATCHLLYLQVYCTNAQFAHTWVIRKLQKYRWPLLSSKIQGPRKCTKPQYSRSFSRLIAFFMELGIKSTKSGLF